MGDQERILKCKAELHDQLRQTNCLFAVLEMGYDRVLDGKREIIFYYFCRTTATCLMLDAGLALAMYKRSPFPLEAARLLGRPAAPVQAQMLAKTCQFLRHSPYGMNPRLLKVHLDMLKAILAHATFALPVEVKELLECGRLHHYLCNQINREPVFLAYLQLMDVMSVDKRAVGLFLEAGPPPIKSSLMAMVVKATIDRFQCEDLYKVRPSCVHPQ